MILHNTFRKFDSEILFESLHKSTATMSQTEPSEEEKKKMYDSLPAEHREKQTYTEWVKEGYNNQYNKWMPWLEDQYLAWFGKDNKASYATKGIYLSPPSFQPVLPAQSSEPQTNLPSHHRISRQRQSHQHRPSQPAARWRQRPSERPGRQRWSPPTSGRYGLERRYQSCGEAGQG